MAPPRASRPRGRIETLPSGSLRVKVFAGVDPVSGRKHVLTEVIPPGPQAKREAERARTKLLAQVDERRNPRTSAIIERLMERHLEILDSFHAEMRRCRDHCSRRKFVQHYHPILLTSATGGAVPTSANP